jgi:hypothetical protein
MRSILDFPSMEGLGVAVSAHVDIGCLCKSRGKVYDLPEFFSFNCRRVLIARQVIQQGHTSLVELLNEASFLFGSRGTGPVPDDNLTTKRTKRAHRLANLKVCGCREFRGLIVSESSKASTGLTDVERFELFRGGAAVAQDIDDLRLVRKWKLNEVAEVDRAHCADEDEYVLRRLTFDMRGDRKAQPFGHPLDGRVRPHRWERYVLEVGDSTCGHNLVSKMGVNIVSKRVKPKIAPMNRTKRKSWRLSSFP